MTDSQQLFAEYRRNGSDAAFRELVSRYIDLVYSTALRLVEGDTHRAEDVTQTVFVDLARKARTLPEDLRLAGWLHRDACFVAANTLRGERRRQSRERQAVALATTVSCLRRLLDFVHPCIFPPRLRIAGFARFSIALIPRIHSLFRRRSGYGHHILVLIQRKLVFAASFVDTPLPFGSLHARFSTGCHPE